MNQPGLGLKVSELRQQKGMTQEQLSEFCQVSSRTIQRIENGEVDPRTHTIQCLSTALDFDFDEQNTSNEIFWLTVLHLSSMICIPIIPLLLWSWKKNQSYEIDQHGRVVLNFQITMALTLFAAAFLLMLIPLILIFLAEGGVNVAQGGPMFTMLIFFVPLPLILIGIYCTYQAVVNVVRVLTDKPIHYAPSISFVK
jgi:transcriptional regulator with XRE-family HTH domain